MNRKFIVVGAGCFGLGALVGWAITADRNEVKLNELREDWRRLLNKKNAYILQLEEDNEELRDAEAHYIAENFQLQGIIPPKKIEEDEVDASEEEDEEIPQEETVEETRTNLQNLIDQYTKNPEDVDTFVQRGTKFQVDKTPPFVIDRNVYAYDPDEGDDYAKITLTYYPTQRVLLDDDEDPIDDVANVVGWRNLNQFGAESGDPDVVFIRNRHLMTDYEVVRYEDEDLPLHVKYGMSKTEFETNKAAGVLKFRTGD